MPTADSNQLLRLAKVKADVRELLEYLAKTVVWSAFLLLLLVVIGEGIDAFQEPGGVAGRIADAPATLLRAWSFLLLCYAGIYAFFTVPILILFFSRRSSKD